MARSKPPKQSFAKDTRTTAASEGSLSAFHPTLPFFAHARLSLDAWHIRVLDPSTTQARNEYVLDKGVACRCLAWGNVEKPQHAQEKSKKKQKIDAGAGTTDAMLAAGLSDGSIQLLSPSREGPLQVLKGGHTGAVTGIAFAGDKVWTVGEDGKAIEWHTATGKQLTTLTIDTSNALRSVAVRQASGSDGPCLLAASYTIQQMTLPDGDMAQSYTNHTSPVHALLFATSTQFISAAEDDRYMNLFTLGNNTQDKSFVAEADVKHITVNGATLCAATSEGAVEVFDLQKATTNGASNSSKRRKSMVANASAKITVSRPDSNSTVSVLDLSLRPDGTLVLVWLEGARVVFETVRVRDAEGQLAASVNLVRAPQPVLGAQTADGQLEQSARPYQDGQARIAAGHDEGDFEMADAADEEAEADVADEDSEEDAEPTLQERLHALEVSGNTPAKQKSTSKQVLQVPSAGSLTTVLTQALKSSDTALLESCLHQSDSKIILATVRRLDPVLSVALLEQLASRLARRPGRAGELGVWVRWTVVVHGGYLSSLPNLVKTLSSLHATLSNRAATLPRLLALQGRLDMVHAQIELRREGDVRQTMQEEASDVEYNEGDSDFSDEEEVELEDASELGGLDTSDEGSAEEDSDEDDEAGDFSDDSEGGDAFAQLDADMEAHAAMDDVESEDMEQSDDEAEA
ncbi:WD40-repeat-containing domain protein [Protomyces lactucae-debilis]|uniref:WD40-repeat-containing domain protein n=1 Tax=Protomyces lactucae-debilis TaxID=2754530 RepID=A0A1Y2FAI6_PROLT|nr:WD40-repeat-containing domain protein [Protomyces lactucae-debilis]ORY80903.1 WD40-repeat-containing domain protein [Protomyces lactucae-debilis]